MKTKLKKFIIVATCFMLAVIIACGYIISGQKTNFCFAEENVGGDDCTNNIDDRTNNIVGYSDYYKSCNQYEDEVNNEEDDDISQEEKEEIYQIICDIEDKIVVEDALEFAKTNYNLSNQECSPSLKVYLDDLDHAIDYYNEYRPVLEQQMNGDEATTSSLFSIRDFFKMILGKIAVICGVGLAKVMGWDLTAELLAHAVGNTTLDSVYYPVNTGSISSSSTFKDILDNEVLEGSGEFTKEIDSADLYYSIHDFTYFKTANNSVVEILDRYDFDPNSQYGMELGEIANYIGVKAQNLGSIIPYQVIIDLTTNQQPTLERSQIEVCGYTEQVVVLGYEDRIIYDISCSEKCVVQTFGSKDTKISLYQCDDLENTYKGKGFGSNTLFYYDFSQGGCYSIEVTLTGKNNVGSTKLVISPYNYENGCDDEYYNIYPIKGTSFDLFSFTGEKAVDINTFTPMVETEYSFWAESNSNTDHTFTVYLIDPRSSKAVVEYIEDEKDFMSVYATGKEFQKKLTGKMPYFLVISSSYDGYSEFRLNCSVVNN